MYIPNIDLSIQKNIIKNRQPVLYRWFEELELLLNNSFSRSQEQLEKWQLLGQGFLLEGDDRDAYLHFLKWVTSTLKIKLIELPHEEVINLKALVEGLNQPTIIYIEPHKWLEDDDLTTEDLCSQQELIKAFSLIKGQPLILTSICSSYGEISECFRYFGRFDRHISWTEPQPETYADDFIEMLGVNILDNEVLNNKKRLGSFLCAEFPSFRRLGMLCITCKRKSAYLNQKLTWKDILEIAVRGTGDGVFGHLGNDLKQIASHEAGHALITILESNGKNIPDYISILPSKDMLGVMVEDYEQSYESLGYMSFSMMQSKIRIMLAGRAGEEVLLGTLGVGVDTANTDLREASWQAFTLMARGGFHADYGKTSTLKEKVGLLVAVRNKVSENADYFQEQARQFLADQYAEVRRMLQKNQDLLKTIQEKLIVNKILLREDVERILASTINPSYVPLAA